MLTNNLTKRRSFREASPTKSTQKVEPHLTLDSPPQLPPPRGDCNPSIIAPIAHKKTLPREGTGAIMLWQTFELTGKVSNRHLETFKGQCGVVLSSDRESNMSKLLSNKIKGATGLKLIKGFNTSKHEQNRRSKQYIQKEG